MKLANRNACPILRQVSKLCQPATTLFLIYTICKFQILILFVNMLNYKRRLLSSLWFSSLTDVLIIALYSTPFLSYLVNCYSPYRPSPLQIWTSVERCTKLTNCGSICLFLVAYLNWYIFTEILFF